MDEKEIILPVFVVLIVGIIVAALGVGYIHNNTLLLDGSNPMEANLDMDENYILETDYNHWVHFTMTQGVTDVLINTVPSGVLIQDRHYHRLTFAADTAPGGVKTCSVSISDGTNTMTVTLTGVETSGYTTTNEFDLDVSAEVLTLSYSQDGGGATEKGFVTIKWHYMENA